MAMRLSRWVLVWILIVGVLVAIEVGVVTGRLTPGDLIGSFFILLLAVMVVSVLSIIGERLGVGITIIVNAFNPEVVVVGGGAIAAGELLLEPARRVVSERALPPSRDQVRIVPAHFGDEAGMVGAAIMALEEGRV